MSHAFLRLVSAGFLAALIACPSTSASQETSVSTLNSTPDTYDGKHVSVPSYVVLAPEAHVLWESKQTYDYMQAHYYDKSFDDKKFDKYCLTIANPRPLLKRIEKFGHKTLVISGIFLKNYLGPKDIDLGACTLRTGLMIDYRDLSRRYPELLAPSELPKNIRP